MTILDKDSMPKLDLNSSKKDIEAFLRPEEYPFIFGIGIFCFGIERTRYDSDEDEATCWICEGDRGALIRLDLDFRFQDAAWLKYFKVDLVVLEIPFLEVGSVIQHLIRLNNMKCFF